MADGIVLLQRGGERGGIERCPSRRIGRRTPRSRRLAGEMAQFRVGEPGEAADAVSVLDRAAQQPQARDVGVRVHPAAVVADGRDGAMTALPRAQRIDADPGQLGDRADRVVRAACRVVFFTGPRSARPPRTRPTPAAPHAMSASVSTNGHWRSVE